MSGPPRYDTFAVEVDGGTLQVGRWGTGRPVVVAAHGITGTHRAFRALAEQLGEEVTLLAPDLRGRGRSNQVSGPFSMAAHADDLVAVLYHVGVQRAMIVGHSMGGFVAVVTAHRHPERVERLVLVDGGLPLELGPLAGRPVDEIVAAVIGPALQRLRMTFPSTAAYLDFWRQHPALGRDWNDYCEDLYSYDLEGEGSALRSGVREAAVLADADSQLLQDDIPAALGALRHPAVLLRAPAGMLGTEPGLYPDAWLADWHQRIPELRSLLVPEVNHYTILLTERGARAVARQVREELGLAPATAGPVPTPPDGGGGAGSRPG
jgi:pimeloyl-ACP methyl ester carboxylesterase